MYSSHNPDPNLEWIETRLTPEGKVEMCYKCRRCGQIINHWECLSVKKKIGKNKD
jgi:hypothetical protein